MNAYRIVACALLGLTSLTCAVRREYAYPIPQPTRAEAADLSQSLLTCAQDRRFSSRELQSMVWVNLDHETLLIFDFLSHDEPHFTVRLGAILRSDAENKQIFADAKRTGDSLLNCAISQ